MWKWLKYGVVAAFGVFLAAWTAYRLWLPPSTTMDKEAYAAMSAYLSGSLIGQPHNPGSPNQVVILYGRTSNGMFRVLPPTWSRFDSRMMRFEAVVRSMHSEPFEKKFTLRAPYMFTNDPTNQEKDLSKAQQRAGYPPITFSKVIFNHDATKAVFYTEYFCGLCGEGRFVAMEKRGERWIVVDEKVTWVS